MIVWGDDRWEIGARFLRCDRRTESGGGDNRRTACDKGAAWAERDEAEMGETAGGTDDAGGTPFCADDGEA